MRILLVRTARRKQAITLGEFMFSEPIGLECIYAVLKNRYEIKILDLMVEKRDIKEECAAWKPDVVGITSLCIDVLSVIELAREVKEFNKDIVTMVGGSQAFLGPESFFSEYIDHVMKYTTTANLSGLFEHIEHNQKTPLIDGIYSRENDFLSTEVEGINEYIIPERSSTARYRKHYSYFGFKPCAIMQTSRGCSSVCKFCLRWKIEGCKEQDEPLEKVIQQIQSIDEPSIMFFDNNFLYNRERLEKFCDMLEEKHIKKNFICYGSVNSIISHPDTLKRLRKNGLRAVLVGYESFSDADLSSYNKKSSSQKNIQAGKILKELDIDCWASFILHPDWDVRDFKAFRKYIKLLKPEISTLSPLTPFPNSYLYNQYKERLLFQKEDYDNWSFSLVSIMPSKMSLRRYYYEFIKCNLYINFVTNTPMYLVKKFGISSLLRTAKGSIRFVNTYLARMLKG